MQHSTRCMYKIGKSLAEPNLVCILSIRYHKMRVIEVYDVNSAKGVFKKIYTLLVNVLHLSENMLAKQ